VITDEVGFVEVAVVALSLVLYIHRNIKIDDVAVLNRPAVGDAMTDHLPHAHGNQKDEDESSPDLTQYIVITTR